MSIFGGSARLGSRCRCRSRLETAYRHPSCMTPAAARSRSTARPRMPTRRIMAEHERRPERAVKPRQALGKGSQMPAVRGLRGQQMKHRAELARDVRLVTRICRVAGDPSFIEKARRRLAHRGVRKAIRQDDSAVLFDLLAQQFSY